MTKVRVRGIYATGLTKLLLEKGFTVVQPSLVIAERFKMAPLEEEPDVVVSDREDKHGLVAYGPEEHLNAFISALREELPNAIVRRQRFELWALYQARVLDHERGLLDLGGVVARLAPGEELGPDERAALVQVVRFDGRKVLVSRFPRLRGAFATLRPFEPGVEVSGRIADAELAARLVELASSLLPEGTGLKWSSRAARAGEEELKADVSSLLAEWQAVRERFERAEAPSKVRPGKAVADVEFPLGAKERLDELRRAVCPTLEGHHRLKACGGELASSVELAEKLLFQGMPEEQVLRLFQEVLARELPAEGDLLAILHVKLDGTVLKLGEGEVLAASPGARELLLARRIRGRGFYDGLNVRKEPGDIALTRTGQGSMRLVTSYLAPDGAYKGTYININTPVEVCPSQVRYVDLEVDICLWPDGRVRVLDEDLLQAAVEEGVITARLAEEAMAEVERVLKAVEEGLIGPPDPEELALLGLAPAEEGREAEGGGAGGERGEGRQVEAEGAGG